MSANVESWNGSSWTEVAEKNTLRYRTAATGSNTAGIIAGGLLGIAIGGIIGAISGSYGSDKIKAMMDRFSDTINETIDKIDQRLYEIQRGR